MELSKLLRGDISVYLLTCLFGKLKKRLCFLSRKRKRKIRSQESSKINNDFTKDQKAVFNKFKDCIKKDPDNMKPIYRETSYIKAACCSVTHSSRTTS